MPSEIDNFAWARSFVVAGAIIIAALIPVLTADDDDEPKSDFVKKTAVTKRPSAEQLAGNQNECKSLRRQPVAVLEKKYEAVYDDHDNSGDTAIPMQGGICWIKWHYDSGTTRNGYVERVRFYKG